MTFEEIFWGFLIALGAGVLIGLQRQQCKWRPSSPFSWGSLALAPGIPLPVGDRNFLIVASAGVVMALLSFKEPLHQAVARISDDDLYATAKFVVLAVVVLPLLPNRTYGPFNVVNPFHVALMVVFIAGISFLGYIAMRLAGPRHGLLATGMLGGLMSSTAVTVSHIHPMMIESAFSAGAVGFVRKQSAHADLAAAIRAVLAGDRFVSPALRDGKEKSNAEDSATDFHEGGER